MVRTKKKNKSDEGDGEQSLLYKRVQEVLSGEVTSEQWLVWMMDDGTNSGVAGESVRSRGSSRAPEGGGHVGREQGYHVAGVG